MASLLEEILKEIDEQGQLDTYKYAKITGRDHQAVVGSIKSIESLGEVSHYGI